MLSQCKSKEDCKVDGCVDKRHHTLIHKHIVDSTNEASSPSEEPDKIMCAAASDEDRERRSYFMTVPVRVIYKNQMVNTYALLDTGSQRTFCEQSLASKLGATGPKVSLPIQTLSSGPDSKVVSGLQISLSVQSMDGANEVILKDVFTVDRIPLQASTIPSQSQLAHMDHLQEVQLSELDDKSVGLLIGLDVPEVFRPIESKYGQEGEPDAIKTLLGWTLFGIAEITGDHDSAHCFNVLVPGFDMLESPPHEFTQSCGLDESNSREDRISLQIMKDSIKQVDGHFQLPLLWRNQNTKLPNNISMARKRLESLKRRLRNDRNLCER